MEIQIRNEFRLKEARGKIIDRRIINGSTIDGRIIHDRKTDEKNINRYFS